MERKRYSQAQIAFALRQAESGTAVEQIVRKMGISQATFYRWKDKYNGLGVAEVHWLMMLVVWKNERWFNCSMASG